MLFGFIVSGSMIRQNNMVERAPCSPYGSQETERGSVGSLDVSFKGTPPVTYFFPLGPIPQDFHHLPIVPLARDQAFNP